MYRSGWASQNIRLTSVGNFPKVIVEKVPIFWSLEVDCFQRCMAWFSAIRLVLEHGKRDFICIVDVAGMVENAISSLTVTVRKCSFYLVCGLVLRERVVQYLLLLFFLVFDKVVLVSGILCLGVILMLVDLRTLGFFG